MASKMSTGELLQIFGIVLAIGKSEHYSIVIEVDTEWNSLDLWLFHSENNQDIGVTEYVTDKRSSFAEILGILKEWTKIIVADRGIGSKEDKS